MNIKIDIYSHYSSVSLTFLLMLFFLSATKTTDAQTSNVSLYTFADFTPNIPSSVMKVFTASIELTSMSTSSFDETVFLTAANAFYSSSFNGFDSLVLLTNATNAMNQTKISFEIRYNDSASLIRETDAVVLNAIGNLSSVKTGLEADAGFVALYSVSTNETTFSFSGNSICSSLNCGGSYAFCVESGLGLSPSCKSDCFGSFSCENDGVCVHQTQTLSPNCNCLAAATVWYIGGRCEYKVEVWMIVVFLIGFVAIICIIVLIGCLCCRRKHKSDYRNTEQQAPSGNNQNKIIHKKTPKAVTGPVQQTHLRPDNGGIHHRQQPATFVSDMETDISVPASPITSAALVTVQESSTESDASSSTREFQPESPLPEQDTRPGQLAQNELVLAGNSESSDHDDTDSSVSSSVNGADQTNAPISGIETHSLAESDVPQGYDALQFPDRHSHKSTENNGRYQTVDFGPAGEKATQTNTKINIVLPDSILMQKI